MDWAAITRALRAVDAEVDVIADCGSAFGHRERLPRAVWGAADLVALAVRPTLSGVHVARNAAEALRGDLMSGGLGADRLTSFTVAGGRSYPAGQIADELVDLAPALDKGMPFDPDAADVLGGLRDQPRRFSRSALMRAAAALAEEVGGRASEYVQDEAPATLAAPVDVPPQPDQQRGAVTVEPKPTSSRAMSTKEPVGQSDRSVVPVLPAFSPPRDRGPVREVMRRPISVPGKPTAPPGPPAPAPDAAIHHERSL